MEVKPFQEITSKIKNLNLKGKIDLVVGIGYGGIFPALLIAKYFNLPLEIIWINFRGKNNLPQRRNPKLLRPINFNYKNKRILLVDDRANTGSTFAKAMENLKGAKEIKTLAVNGRANFSLYNEECFTFPWNI